MRVDLKVVSLSLALIVAPFVAQAQRCVGAPSFRTSSGRLGVDLSFTDGAKGYGANVVVGSPRGLFGSAGVGAMDYDGTSEGSTTFSFSGGLAVPFGATTGKAEFCPILGVSFLNGPDVGPVDVSGHTVSFGAMLGGVAATTPTTEIVPFGGAVYVNESVRARTAGGGPIPGSFTATNDGVHLIGGAGFVVSRVLTITPSLSFPIGEDNTDATFGISFAYNFGVARQVSTRR